MTTNTITGSAATYPRTRATIEIKGRWYEVALSRPAKTPLRAAYLDAVRELIAVRVVTRLEAVACDVAEERAERARVALADSSEPEHWTAREESGGRELGVVSINAARRAAREWVEGGDYGDLDGTIWCDVHLLSETGHEDSILSIAIDPDEPECSEASHDWQSPHEIVGGIEENPGVWGHGGGVTCREVCSHCGCERHTDTWAQRADTGEQGLTSVAYTMAVAS